MSDQKRKPRKQPDAEHVPAQPYQIHRPDVAAIDVQPRAGEYPVPLTYSIGEKIVGTGTLWVPTNRKK